MTYLKIPRDLRADFMEANMSRLFSLIQFYFGLGLRHWELLVSLSNIDGIVISSAANRTPCR